MKHTLRLEIDIDDYARLPSGNVWDLVARTALAGAQEHIAYQFGGRVQVSLPPAQPVPVSPGPE